MANPGKLHEWVSSLPSRGMYSFTRNDANQASAASDSAVKMTLYRLKRNGVIVAPRRDFFVYVPVQYRTSGSPPASWFVDALMKHLNRTYYVGLLSAAALHGAGHQSVMRTQIIADAPERDIEVGRVRIEFHSSNLLKDAATERVQTHTGSMTISTPETTLFDLVRFPSACGFWSNVATVVSELVEEVVEDKLVQGADRVARTDVQRLGWLLDYLGEHGLAQSLQMVLAERKTRPIALSRDHSLDAARLCETWNVLVNVEVELDL